MGTIKIIGFDEDGNAQRLKIRIARILDYDPVTGADKENIRDSLGVSPDATGLVRDDIGSGAGEVSVNQMLGSLAYQSAEAVSAGTVSADQIGIGTSTPSYELEVQAANARVASTSDGGVVNHLQSTATTGFVGTHTNHPLALKTNGSTRCTIDSTGRVGINQTSPGSYNGSADDLVVGDAVGHRGITISSGSGNSGNIYFADGTSGDAQYRGYIGYNQSSDIMSFGTGASTQWQISSGNLVAYAAGVGIDFGSGASTTLDDYEEGVHTTTASPASSGSITLATSYDGLAYTKMDAQSLSPVSYRYPVLVRPQAHQ